MMGYFDRRAFLAHDYEVKKKTLHPASKAVIDAYAKEREVLGVKASIINTAHKLKCSEAYVKKVLGFDDPRYKKFFVEG